LPIVLASEEVDQLFAEVTAKKGAEVVVDLEAQTVTSPSGDVFEFLVDTFRKHCLLNGLDDIGLTLQNEDSIRRFEEKRMANAPWLFLSRGE